MVVYDETGQKFKNLKEACRYHGVIDSGRLYMSIKAYGSVKKNGHTFYLKNPNGEEEKDESLVTVSKSDLELLNKMKEKYNPTELIELAAGRGFARPISYPKIVLHGKKHKIMVISDTHIGSKYSPVEWHTAAASIAKEEKVEFIIHCGDVTEGLKKSRMGTQMYELTDLGFDSQKEKAIELLSKYKLPIYAISGNHDAFFKDSTEADVVKAIADNVKDMTYLGYDSADMIIDGTTLRIWHGGDANAYALSYRLQKVIESLPGGTKPAILLAGHVHKFCYIFERNIHAISVPSMQMQTPWMRGKKIASHTGFLIIEFETDKGDVCNLSVKLYPFFSQNTL